MTEPDERVVEIAVEKGQKVAKGDLLFTIDTELLQEKILNQRQEIEKQKLQLGDVGSQQDVRAAQKANESGICGRAVQPVDEKSAGTGKPGQAGPGCCEAGAYRLP